MSHPVPVPESQIRLSPMYTGNEEFLGFLATASQEFEQGEVQVGTAKVLATHLNALIMSESVQTDLWDVLARHYAADGLELGEKSMLYRPSDDILAAVTCDRFGVPVRTAVDEFRSRDWAGDVAPYERYSYGSRELRFSTFVNACQKVALVGELSRRRESLQQAHEELMKYPSWHRHDELAPMRKQIERLESQLHGSGLPGSDNPEEMIMLFGNTATARAFVTNSKFELPEETGVPQIGMTSAQENTLMHRRYSLDRIMQPATAPQS